MKRVLIAGLIVAAAVFGVYKYVADNQAQKNENSAAPQIASDAEQKSSLPLIDLQPTVDEWAAKQSGTASVVIYDLANKKNIASLNPGEQYFAASIYKLYVAYEGYRKVDNGEFKPDEIYLNGWSRGKCLDQMIRTSHSPCAEKMWVELGKESTTEVLTSYGLKNTSMTGLYTSAQDAALVLARIENAVGISAASRIAFLDSMLNQIYRDGLPKGFAGSKFYDKVGFRETVEYHDVGILELAGGRKYVVSVLTKNTGTRQISALADAIQDKLNN